MTNSDIVITYTGASLRGEITLPSSKSISNRALIIQALTNPPFLIGNISTADDTQTLETILKEKASSIYTGDGGTTFRFLMAYLCTLEQPFELSGSLQFNCRPIAPLVDALQKLGATIHYMNNEGFAPVQIFPRKLIGGDVEVDTTLSSQFISALMIIGPTLPNGIRIHLSPESVSESYIRMTASVMNQFGIQVTWKGRTIEVSSQKYQSKPYIVESDWSSAAFWYQWISLLPNENRVLLKGLKRTGMQGDEEAWSLFGLIGVNSEEKESGIEIYRIKDFSIHNFSGSIDLKNCPDLAPALICAMAARSIKVTFTGLQTLAVKESNRIKSLQQELGKLGVTTSAGNNWLSLDSYQWNLNVMPLFDTHKDHRIAMALAPFSVMFRSVQLNSPEVVNKSYPEYWNHLIKAGLIQFNIM